MNQKYHEFAGKILPVVSASGIVALLIRLKLMDGKPDDFFFNMMFVLMLIFIATVYSHIFLLGNDIIDLVTRLFRGKNKNKNQIKEEKLIDYQKDNEIKPEISTVQLKATESLNIDPIRKAQQQKKLQIESDKLKIALNYTKHQFAIYISDQDLDLLCNAVISYSKKEKATNTISIETKGLSTLDLYHFGWNIWNHYRPIKQEQVAEFLENTFQKLNKYPIQTIVKHLTDPNTKDTIIKQLDNLADYNNN